MANRYNFKDESVPFDQKVKELANVANLGPSIVWTAKIDNIEVLAEPGSTVESIQDYFYDKKRELALVASVEGQLPKAEVSVVNTEVTTENIGVIVVEALDEAAEIVINESSKSGNKIIGEFRGHPICAEPGWGKAAVVGDYNSAPKDT